MIVEGERIAFWTRVRFPPAPPNQNVLSNFARGRFVFCHEVWRFKTIFHQAYHDEDIGQVEDDF